MTKHIKPGSDPYNLEQYRNAGGYSGVSKALKGMTPVEIKSLVRIIQIYLDAGEQVFRQVLNGAWYRRMMTDPN